ncbi:ADP-glyceromanno-heptose 6-epimerase precursor [Desulfobulbus propionicus DSM 2032]|jgi:ADP-L-glycero-D-manno-heptose 6-epimerase|uniref:ADP-L-glycero-D-manno-heptose-6-epimerase n=1 Tax=Desulfobulbus propionicus (strain ATCC 33891 / DSM 2032 / VKM B-1956 / 1pr3) TaxID=577650 RepID=A0A7U4DQI3_DESPD|nr:ADP-glyceromanno-heptose 6-epimerase [Desulfobulbus propionicus]ADW19261.1 ADP-glyceromanno-heptose 6-epimerase precursor [Desulfobulbus propionicus DSM 2032]
MIIVTGGLGFIGSNIIHALNARGVTDIIVVDDFTDGTKFTNVSDAQVADYFDKDEFLTRVQQGQCFNGKVDALLHQGACSATTEWNGKLVMENNFTYSKELFHYADQHRIPFIYASSASVYGNGTTFIEDPRFERPINVYAYSKTLFDQYVRRHVVSGQSQVVGLRYFNVYGPREQHKGGMASVAFHLRNQLLSKKVVHLFEGSDGYGPGEQRRDFIHVEDAVDVILWFLEYPAISGIFNVGTGKSQSFNEVAQAVLTAFGYGELQYIPFPEHLKGRYQSFTEADITRLREAGYNRAFRSVESGVLDYMEWLGQGEPIFARGAVATL